MVCHSRPAAVSLCESCGLNPPSHTACAHLGILQQKTNVLQHLQKPILASFSKTLMFRPFYLGILQNHAISMHVCSQPLHAKTPLFTPHPPPIRPFHIKTQMFYQIYLGVLQNYPISMHVCSQPNFQKAPLLLPPTPQLGVLQKNPNVLLPFTRFILASFRNSSMFCNLLTTPHAPNPLSKHNSSPSPSRSAHAKPWSRAGALKAAPIKTGHS